MDLVVVRVLNASVLLVLGLCCLLGHDGQAQTTTPQEANTDDDVLDLFPSDLYDISNLPPEFPMLVAGAAAVLLAIVLALGVGCYCVERKRRADAALVSAYIAKEREEERRRVQEENARRAAREHEAAVAAAWAAKQANANNSSTADREAASQQQRGGVNSLQEVVSDAHPATSTTDPRTPKNWGMDTSFLF